MNKLAILSVFLAFIFVLTPISSNAQYYGCSYHSYQRCVGNNLYWYDSCGNQQELSQYCNYGCYNNSCQNHNYYNYSYNNCTYHAYKLCSGNNIYWYDSCGNQQDLYSSCTNGLFCQYGQCVTSLQNNNIVNYNPYYKIACYGNSIYWFDSLGVKSGLYKKCSDNNNCTQDTCSIGKCTNILKCDGTTCAINSVDYNNYCALKPTNSIIDPSTTPNTNTTPNNNLTACTTEAKICPDGSSVGRTGPNCEFTPCPNQNNNQNQNINNVGLSISFFAKENSQWQKTIQVGSNGQVYFMISATNSSNVQIDNIKISTNIPTEVYSLGNLQINGVLTSGDIVKGIDIGSIAPQNTKLITFEGKTQSILEVSTKEATATSDISGTKQTDSISLNFTTTTNPNQNQPAAAAAISESTTISNFWNFLKRWYIWIMGGIVLIFLFIIIYKRLLKNI